MLSSSQQSVLTTIDTIKFEKINSKKACVIE